MAYGTYDIQGTKGLKLQGKALTKRGEVTEALWRDHLSGKQSLGIVPINEENLCRWGCIDVDEYANLDVPALQKLITKKKLPLHLFMSKSGGVHVFLLLEDFVPAALIRTTLQKCAAQLGLSGSEIFPKQITVMWDRGNIGNWLNMPYFGTRGWPEMSVGN